MKTNVYDPACKRPSHLETLGKVARQHVAHESDYHAANFLERLISFQSTEEEALFRKALSRAWQTPIPDLLKTGAFEGNFAAQRRMTANVLMAVAVVEGAMQMFS